MLWLSASWLLSWASAQTPPRPLGPLEPLSGPRATEVTVEVQLDREGWVTAVILSGSSGDPALDLKALRVALLSSYAPALDAQDTPVASVVTLRIPVVSVLGEGEPDPSRPDPPGLPSEEILVIGTAEQQLAEQIVTLEEIRYLPGSGGDIVRALQNLPGVARPPFSLGQLLVRGTSPEDSSYYLDGVEIPLVFHFGGLSTVLNADLLDDVRFLAGGYGVRYGRALGGVIDLRAEASLPTRSSGYASVDLFQGTAFGEVLAGQSSITLSARRSYIDTLLEPFIDKQIEETVRAPRFWDLQLRLNHDAGRDRLDALLLAADDAFRVLGDDEDDVLVDLGIHMVKARLRWLRSGDGPWRGEVSTIVGPEREEFFVDPDGIALEERTVGSVRAEVERVRGDDPLGLLLGIEGIAEDRRWVFDVPTFGDPDEGEVPLAVTLGAYAEATGGFEPVEISTGVRIDRRTTDAVDSASVMVDPRTVARWRAGHGTDVEGSMGVYSQFPTLRGIEPGESSDLRPERSLSSTLGVRHQLSEAWDLQLTGFHNQLIGLVVGRQDAFAFFTTPPKPGPLDRGAWANDGTGTITGTEIRLRTQSLRTSGWIAATLARSIRVDREGEAPHPFAYDQPLNLVALITRQLPRGWRLGGRLRFAVGTPYTATVSHIQDQDSRTWLPIYGPELGARLPPFFALDARLDKRWDFERWRFSLYLDVTNATNRSNVELMSFSPDFSEERPITGLPMIPAFGFRTDL
ncbi:MAG TPA: TonB-dependent receptor [Deltaproteobacteria bacterium]|nr:TonB-dependent receptor [Deltaproteobacteria bacterium]